MGCLLPLLANARHKVLLVSDAQWPYHPAGRAHWRLLWTVGSKEEPLTKSEPRLWLEPINCDFAAATAGIGAHEWEEAVLWHAVAKANAMQVPLSLEASADIVRHIADRMGVGGQVLETCERMLLRPSNGVVEASDILGPHDWEQSGEEITWPIDRLLYVPLTKDMYGGQCEYRVLQGMLFKKTSLDPTTRKIVKLVRPVGSIVKVTGRRWTGPSGGEWVELDSEVEKPGWMLIEGPGFGVSGALLEKVGPA